MNSYPDLAIESSGLTKHFGDVAAVDGINLAVAAGSIYSVLGPNGAGKTTLVRILATLLQPDGGEARVLGHDVVREAEAILGRISLTGQFASVDEDLTGAENLILLGRLLGYSRSAARKRANDLLEAFDLTEAAARPAKTYSGGMKRRLDIAASIIVTPDLLFLDEPTTGLDPRSRSQVWEIVREIVASGTTVLLTTQYLDEADQLADRIAVIDHGRLIAEGTSGQLKASIGSGALHVRLLDPARSQEAEALLAQSLAVTVRVAADRVSLWTRMPASGGLSDAAGRAAAALATLSGAGITVTEFALGQPSLDEVFLTLTGQPVENGL